MNKAKFFSLTRSEMEIMELLWQENRPLSRTTIIEKTPQRTWKPSSIHILLNSMLDKEAIKIAGFEQSGRRIARTFSPTVSADEYSIMQIKSRSDFQESNIPHLVSALIEKSSSEQLIDELEQILEEKRKDLKDDENKGE